MGRASSSKEKDPNPISSVRTGYSKRTSSLSFNTRTSSSGLISEKPQNNLIPIENDGIFKLF